MLRTLLLNFNKEAFHFFFLIFFLCSFGSSSSCSSVCTSLVSYLIGGLLSGPFGVFISSCMSDFSPTPTRPFLPILKTKISWSGSDGSLGFVAADSAATVTVGFFPSELSPLSKRPDTLRTTGLPQG